MGRILQEVCAWATQLPYWEQAALAMILEGKQFDEDAYDRLAHYLLQDAGLEDTDLKRPALRFHQAQVADDLPPSAGRRLTKVCNLNNVNALVPGQRLTFDSHLTLIYGENGSGKSGYARVLACAGFCRGNCEVLPDVTLPATPSSVRSAEIYLSDREDPIEYVIDGGCPSLSGFYVFDNASVVPHLAKQHSFFSPAGLSYLTELTEVTDEVRRRVRTQITERSKPHNFNTFFPGVSETATSIANLSASTDLPALRRQASVTPDDEERLALLDRRIAELKSQNIPQQVAKLQQTSTDLGALADRLRHVERALSEDAINKMNAAVKDYQALRAEASASGAEQFRSDRFSQVGERVWHDFLRAAKTLADAERTADQPYPGVDDQCLLCRQRLSPEARDLLLRLWSFLESDAQVRLNDAAAALNRTRDELASMGFDFLAPESAAYREIKERDEDLLGVIATYVRAGQLRRDEAHRMIAERQSIAIPALPCSPVPAVEALIDRVNQSRLEVEGTDPSKEIARLAEESLALQHRITLKEHVAEIETYVDGLVWCKKAEKALGDTKHITQKYSELFKRLITGDYIKRFEETLAEFGRPLQVTVETTSRKGETLKRLVLANLPESDAHKVTPDRVLSDGEKQAVALADFLTEASLDEDCMGILLDDPVGFLDNDWQEAVAARLATEAQSRQVVVLTNNLPFLYKLQNSSQKRGVDTATHWIKRGDHDDRPGYVYLDSGPVCEEHYKTSRIPRERYKEAVGCGDPAEQQRMLLAGFDALRTCYEALAVFGLLGGVVRRFEEQISMTQLKTLVWSAEIAETVTDKHALLSRFIGSHLHSDMFAAEKPTPERLRREIEEFDALKKKHRTLQTSAAS
jgi:ABC-type dipeptide/oligopeptide/nickel transport system ATPase subunit